MTRYDRITLDYNVEFAGPGTSSIEPTFAEVDDPRFRAFLEWYGEIRRSRIKADPDRQMPFL